MTSDRKDTAGDESKAEDVLNENNLLQKADSNTPPATKMGWTCPKCGTDVELPRDVCWNCLYNPSAC